MCVSTRHEVISHAQAPVMQMFDVFMKDEDALLRAANAQWAIVPASFAAAGTGPTDEPAMLIDEGGATVGRMSGCGLVLEAASVSGPASLGLHLLTI